MSATLENLRKNCSRCNGNVKLCHAPRCPVRLKLFSLNNTKKIWGVRTDFDSINPPAFFVGSTNWPQVTITPMMSLDINNPVIDEPDEWQTDYKISDIVQFRTNLIRAYGRRIDARAVEDLEDRILTTTQELVLSSDPINISLILKKPLIYKMNFSKYHQPVGPEGEIKSFKLEDTPKIDHKVEYIISDTDLIAKQGIAGLFNSDLSVSRISRILSAGLLGIKGQRRLVPTRWSITATDDQVGQELIKEIKNYSELSEIQVFESLYLDNHFIIIILPNQWSYEFLEVWGLQENSKILGDYELSKGRTKYASNSAGGYYAARLSVLEYLKSIKRQARVYCWREVGDNYYIPLGVWQVRENVRSAFKIKPKIFDDKALVFEYVEKRMKIPLKRWLKASQLTKNATKQQSLQSFLTI